MKKIILILLGMFLLSSSTPYSIKCYKCRKAGVHAIANRSFADEYSGRPEPEYCIYKCQYGHTLYVNYDTGDRK